MTKRISKTGLGLCTLYLAFTALCVWGSLTTEGDPKGEFVLRQLPLTGALLLVDGLGLDSALDGLSWVACYALLVPLTLAFLYGFGWLVGKAIKTTKK